MDPERRHLILLAALAAATRRIVDETLRVFDMMLSSTDGNVRDEIAKRQLDALHANLDRLELMEAGSPTGERDATFTLDGILGNPTLNAPKGTQSKFSIPSPDRFVREITTFVPNGVAA